MKTNVIVLLVLVVFVVGCSKIDSSEEHQKAIEKLKEENAKLQNDLYDSKEIIGKLEQDKTILNNEIQSLKEELGIIEKKEIKNNAELLISETLEGFKFRVEVEGTIYTPVSSYWNPSGPWEVFKLVDDEWKLIVPNFQCLQSCDKICTTGPIGCVDGGDSPVCHLVDSSVEYEWDKLYLSKRDQRCNGDTYQCEYNKFAETGKYKIVFSYIENCSEGELFDDDSIIIEKEFEI